MIAVQGKQKRFRELLAYLVREDRHTGEDRVVWSAVRNLPTDDPDLAVLFMRATAAQSSRIEKPVYHMALTFAPDDPVDRAVMERVADRVLRRLGLAEYQALLVAHGDRPHHPHVHILVNRIHPVTGLAWRTWHDWRLTNQVLREEERTLGLRRVQTPVTKVEELTRDLQAYERVAELTNEHYRTHMEASAARARHLDLELLAERTRTMLARRDEMLRVVYRDPKEAYRAFVTALERDGAPAATRAMRERPDQFGQLVTVERSRALGLVQVADESRSRAAAPEAAIAARDAAEAERAWHRALDSEARRMELAFERELGKIYADPAVARTAFERLAATQGPDQAATTLREQPEALAPVLAPAGGDPRERAAQAAQAATRGIEVFETRVAATQAIGAPGLDVTVPLTRAEFDQATARERAISAELASLPEQAALERRLSVALAQLLPREMRLLRTAITAPQLAIVTQLSRVARDLALGQGEERGQER